MPASNLTAALLIIGDEILSGRTADANLSYLAQELGSLGIEMCEARVVRDVPEAIVGALNTLRQTYHYVFTTGGIGPTHDDITAECVAQAFGVAIAYHDEALARVQAQCDKVGITLNEARKRMARIPVGASLIDNVISGAPGFRMDNVFVLAGVPAVMRAMAQSLLPSLQTGAPWQSVTIEVHAGEGDIAPILDTAQATHAKTRLGSYPFFEQKRFGVRLVIRSQDAQALAQAEQDLHQKLSDFLGESKISKNS